MSEDRKFFDFFTLVIGILVGIAFGIFLIASQMGEAQLEATRADASYQDLVVARLAPAGQVTRDGETRAVTEVAEPAAAEPLAGPDVYAQACAACHAGGAGGAPVLGDTAAWQPRLAQDDATLAKHVLQGFTGDAGYMPPKGGRVDLSDEEVLGAMAYLLEQSR